MYVFYGVFGKRSPKKQMTPNILLLFMDGWKLCQKMRLDALIIFLIE